MSRFYSRSAGSFLALGAAALLASPALAEDDQSDVQRRAPGERERVRAQGVVWHGVLVGMGEAAPPRRPPC